LKRKYNQAALLAYALAQRTGIPYSTALLMRRQSTLPQMTLDRDTRLRNVRRAFALKTSAKKLTRGKVIVLVDDVVTTGATVNACAKLLRRAGAREVRVLALARTVRE
jgi:ComF family protein